jgi:hypothetical protein
MEPRARPVARNSALQQIPETIGIRPSSHLTSTIAATVGRLDPRAAQDNTRVAMAMLSRTAGPDQRPSSNSPTGSAVRFASSTRASDTVTAASVASTGPPWTLRCKPRRTSARRARVLRVVGLSRFPAVRITEYHLSTSRKIASSESAPDGCCGAVGPGPRRPQAGSATLSARSPRRNPRPPRIIDQRSGTPSGSAIAGQRVRGSRGFGPRSTRNRGRGRPAGDRPVEALGADHSVHASQGN